MDTPNKTVMKAIVSRQYGPPEVLQIEELERPIPKADEILIRIHATSVNYGDLLARNFKDVSSKEFNMPYLFWLLAKISFGSSKPKTTILGSELAGEVVGVGADVKSFKAGDQVFGYVGQSMGAYAEYMCMPEGGVVTYKPANMTYEEAAVVPMGAIMAIFLLRKMNIRDGQKVLILGASGSIGSAAVQIAKHYGAEVTGVGGTPRLEFVKSLGADKVIDYKQEDFTQSGETYDLIFDVLGKGSFSDSKNSLTSNGRYLYASFKMKQLFQMLWTSIVGRQKVICGLAPGSIEDLKSVKELIEAGDIKVMIDQRFPMEKAAEAHRYVESGQKQGSVVITMDHES